MKLWIVDHDYGVCLVAAKTKADAEFLGDEHGRVLGVYEYKGRFCLHVERVARAGVAGLDVSLDGDPEQELLALIDAHNITFNRAEYEAQGPSRTAPHGGRDE